MMFRLSAPGAAVPRSRAATEAFQLGVQFVLTVVCMTASLRLWNTDLRVPFNYWGDTIFELILTKSIADGDWIWFIHRLGAPFGLDIAAFPQNLFFSSLIMKIIAIFTKEPGLILNLFWILSAGLTSVICHVALRPLGLTRRSLFVLSTLFALLPHVFFRNVSHVSLTYMFVPVVCAQALLVLARNRQQGDEADSTDRKLPLPLLVVSGLAIGVDYIYTAFFSCFFLAVAGTAGFCLSRRRAPLVSTLPLIALICASALVNLTPSLLSWHRDGTPASVTYKSPAEAETYGLKIRHLVSPIFTDVLGPPNVDFPLENENVSAKLGVVGGAGFVVAVVAALFSRRRTPGNQLWAAGVLTVAGLLLATVGGFGSIFNVLVSPDIRAYNRISVFIAFFSFYALFDVIERVRLRFLAAGARGADWVFSLVLVTLFVGGVLDQGAVARILYTSYDVHRKSFETEREFVSRIESVATHTHRIFQLPIVPFPSDAGRERMLSYDHGRPYLWSDRMSWSWPGLSDSQVAFESGLTPEDPKALVRQLAVAGFDGLWIDRFAFRSEVVESLERELKGFVQAPPLISRDDRYVFIDLSDASRAWQEAHSPDEQRLQREAMLRPRTLKYGKGFFAEETAQGGMQKFRWSGKSSDITFVNPSGARSHFEFTASVHGNAGGVLSVLGPRGMQQKVHLGSGEGRVVLSLDLDPKENAKIEFLFEGTRIDAPGDPRAMYFSLINPKIRGD
ncbi:hypothetical protein QTI33_14300 [Variovorax sp. J22P271]|uniref:hypothetical protein n=1 Tax=Variovorax davisae TaxID=3053515 RepID=UPI002574AA7F|nr:hypothetical protein [Variovorax sp. J22P271]MDM0033302.1 hypothetical protein [Variovorax sp. J22P271]